jgi:hypothetical protein
MSRLRCGGAGTVFNRCYQGQTLAGLFFQIACRLPESSRTPKQPTG